MTKKAPVITKKPQAISLKVDDKLLDDNEPFSEMEYFNWGDYDAKIEETLLDGDDEQWLEELEKQKQRHLALMENFS